MAANSDKCVEMPEEVVLKLKWNNQEFEIPSIPTNETVGALKELIFDITSVRPERQKLINLKFRGKMPEDDRRLSELNSVANGFKIMMVGSLEKSIEDVDAHADDFPDVVDDWKEEEVKIDHYEINHAKIRRRISEYKINMISETRPGKKLLVLDIDYTLFDHRSVGESGYDLMRPFLHEFLTDAYENYDIVIWSATSMKWIEEKMKVLGVAKNPNYKIAFYMDINAMISIQTDKYGLTQIKPLAVIWGKFLGVYTPRNTIMFDDIRRNFLLNPKNGLHIKPYRKAHLNRGTDRELLKLAKYLKLIAFCEDFTALKHNNWEKTMSDGCIDGEDAACGSGSSR